MSTKPNDSEAKVHAALKDVIWQNHALAQANHGLLLDLKKAHDEIFDLRAKPVPPAAQRPSVVR